MNSLKIYIKDRILEIPDEFLEPSGDIVLDMSPDAEFGLDKEFDKLTRFNEITGDALLPTVLPSTPKNDFILKAYGYDYLTVFENVTPIAITCMLEGWHVTRQDSLFVRSLNSNSKNAFWEIEILNGEDYWKRSMSGLKLRDIDLGTFTFTKVNTQLTWFGYYGGGAGYMTMAPVHYGNWLASYTAGWAGNVVPEDIRPLFFITGVIEKAFSMFGWTFQSPLLYTTEWLGKVCYILAEEISYDGQAEYFRVNAPKSIGVHISFDPMVGTQFDAVAPPGGSPHDPSGSWTYVPGSPGDSYWSNVHYFNQELKIELDVTISSLEAYPMTLKVHIWDRINAVTYKTFTFTVPAVGNFRVITETDYFIPVAGAEIIVYFEYVTLPSFFTPSCANGEVMVIMKKDRMYLNDVIQLNHLIHPDYTFFDFLKGILHCIGGGRIVTDWDNGTVTLYQADSTELCDGSVPEPFYIERQTELEAACNSMVSNIGTLEQSRFLQLCFQEPDEYLQSLGFSDTNKPYSKTVDLGELLRNNDTQVSENPFFYPTGQIIAAEIDSGDGQPVQMPAMWDNTDNEISYDIAPRILQSIGIASQLYSLPSFYMFWSWGDFGIVTQTLIPMVFQTTGLTVSSIITGLTGPICENTVYGDQPNDFYSNYWVKEVKRLLILTDIELLVFVSLLELLEIDGRDVYEIIYKGNVYFLRLVAINNKAPGTRISTPMTLSKTV